MAASARLVVITGANRGFGRCVALAAASRWPGADLLLTHRAPAAQQMRSVVDELSALGQGGRGKVVLAELDLSGDPGSLHDSARRAFTEHASGSGPAYLINNAGTLGPMTRCDQLAPSDVVAHVAANVTAPLLLTQAFLSIFGKRAVLVNVSSLLAVQPMAGFTLYAQAKAARDMALACAAKEGVRGLNYAPGPMNTEMAGQIRAEHYDDGTRASFTALRDEGKTVDPAASARVLVALLDEDTYESGAHVDFFDRAKHLRGPDPAA
eukprot:TRINITY_DN16189_c0_g1_i1.p1 TRINITY_DN16189_c0_g1~~TRINITY_DN16189_c0_g1_i1.p1  ORF type:complete len:266 (+),score=54.46 TRINITY_DN16189_c0_g1_i1:74-871(+)